MLLKLYSASERSKPYLMKKLLTALCLCAGMSGFGQTLFYYGNDSVSSGEFLRAYQKNNTSKGSEKALREYLNLYINSRLKVKEAVARHYDTLPQLKADLENLRQQILPSFVIDREQNDRLLKEAYERGQKDLHVQHIFISLQRNGVYDTLAAQQRLKLVEQALRNTPFTEVARNYSDDPSAKTNQGDLGYITVFTLPYELENLAYGTPVGHTSAPYRSKAGYHIFQVLGERRALGGVKASQILLAFPPDADAATKAQVRKKADSIYQRLLKGDDFTKLATQNSNDVTSLAANGQMPDINVGQYEPAFENTVYALNRDGEVSKPFLTRYGYHIVKRIAREPATFQKSDSKAMENLRIRIQGSDRINVMRMQLAERILKESGLEIRPFSKEELWAYTDSVVNYMKPPKPVTIKGETRLFQLANQNYTVNDWITYAQMYRYKPDGSGMKPYEQVWDEFVHVTALNLYQSHLETYNDAFRQQINEFRDGNLFFEIMQRQIWGPAQSDTTALLQYFRKNWMRYAWKASASAVIFYINDPSIAKSFWNDVKKAPDHWHQLVDQFSEKVAADSGRFEIAQIPNPTKTQLRPGVITGEVVNPTDKTSSFAYVLSLYEGGNNNDPKPRTFAEAKGMVITDYQNELEKEWMAILKKKYPVTINEKALDELIRAKQY